MFFMFNMFNLMSVMESKMTKIKVKTTSGPECRTALSGPSKEYFWWVTVVHGVMVRGSRCHVYFLSSFGYMDHWAWEVHASQPSQAASHDPSPFMAFVKRVLVVSLKTSSLAKILHCPSLLCYYQRFNDGKLTVCSWFSISSVFSHHLLMDFRY